MHTMRETVFLPIFGVKIRLTVVTVHYLQARQYSRVIAYRQTSELRYRKIAALPFIGAVPCEIANKKGGRTKSLSFTDRERFRGTVDEWDLLSEIDEVTGDVAFGFMPRA